MQKNYETDEVLLFCSMVAEKVEVFTRSSKVGSPGLRWVSDGTGTYEIEEVDGVDIGTTIVLHLKNDCREYADEERIKGTIDNRLKNCSTQILC